MPHPTQLLGKVATRRNLQGAWEDISRSTRPLSRGSSEQTIQDFQANWKANLEVIRKELLHAEYRFGRVRAVTIKKKRGKKRPLRVADVRDRVVQRAMTRVLEKHLVKPFDLKNPASHAYLRGKGVQSAIKQMLRFHQDGCRIVFEADIVDFFDTVDIERLLRDMIIPTLPDTTLSQLIEAAFNMEIGNKDDLPEEDWELYPESSTGLPQGGYLSPLCSNIYLSLFDHRMLEANFKLIRYADDFIVMCKSLEEAEAAYIFTREILERKLGLRLHPRDDDNPQARTRIIRVSQTPIKFLGIEFNGSRIWPASEKRKALSEKMAKLRSSVDVRRLLISMSNLIEGWIASYGFTDINSSYAKSIDDEVNKHLWIELSRRQWKLKPKHLSYEQRDNSGVRFVSWYLDKIRNGLSDRELLTKYWTE